MTVPQPLNKPGFRADINGLRGYAVLAVVLFHFDIPGFSGGFVGVDIFFVISGFLMTSIIVSRLEQQRFSLIDFYLARAQRILPALIVLCGLLLVMGWLILPALEYERLAAHSAYTLTFLSNIEYYLEAGYFDAASDEKWLLHTWSLSVEWQFYLLLPLFLWGVSILRLSRRVLVFWLAAATLISLGLSIYITPKNPSMAFYYIHTRAWEMLLGGLLVFAPRLGGLAGRWLEAVGFLLIAYALFFLHENTAWPGWQALFPVLGTTLVLLACREGSLLTDNPLMQRLGDWSYSVYLYHWPVVVLLGYLSLQHDLLWVSAGVVLSLVLGWLSFRLVETPTRRWLSGLHWRGNMSALALKTAAVLSAAIWVHSIEGANWRMPESVEIVSAEQENTNPRQKQCHKNKGAVSPGCVYGGEMIGAILIGDSHAAANVTAVELAAEQVSRGVVEWTYGGCKTIQGIKQISYHPFDPATYDCHGFNDWIIASIEEQGSSDIPIILINRSSSGLGDTEAILSGYIGGVGAPSYHFGQPFKKFDHLYLNEIRQRMIATSCHISA